MRELLAGAIRFGFRVHQFVGGFDAQCADAFQLLSERNNELSVHN